MAISIDAYRQAIGFYNFSDKNYQYKINGQSNKKKMTRSKCILFLTYILILLSSISDGFVNEQSRNQTKSTSVSVKYQDQKNTSVISCLSPDILLKTPSFSSSLKRLTEQSICYST